MLEVLVMAKMTKTQKKNALNAIQSKAFALVGAGLMTVQDFGTIQKMVARYLNKL